jgi:CCR4-NOT transcriptional complex subunit CAF120
MLPSTLQSSPVDESISNEAGALYFMRNDLGGSQVTSPNSDPEDGPKSTSATPGHHQAPIKPPVRQDTPMAFLGNTSGSSLLVEAERSTSPNTRLALNRRPTGARGSSNNLRADSEQRTEIAAGKEKAVAPSLKRTGSGSSNWQSEDPNLDTLAANAWDYLDKAESSNRAAPNAEAPDAVEPTAAVEPPPPSDENVDDSSQYKSSFAPSKQAADRKLRSQAQQDAHRLAVHTPGRLNGKKKAKEGDVGAWNMSSDDEEEEEEEDEDDDLDSDAAPPAGGSRIIAEPAVSGSRIIAAPPLVPPPPPPPPPIAQVRPPQTYGVGLSPVVSSPDGAGVSMPKPIRHLPQIPGKPAGELYSHFPSIVIVDMNT